MLDIGNEMEMVSLFVEKGKGADLKGVKSKGLKAREII